MYHWIISAIISGTLWIGMISSTNAQDNKIELFELNSPEVEYAPSISADGQVLLFQSNRSGKYELYESNLKSDGSWTTPSTLTGAINDYGTDQDLIGGPSITYDGNRIYFFASYDSGYGSEDIYYSDRVKDGWSSPVNVGNTINTKNYEGFPNISSDGKSLYFMRLNKQIVNNLNCYTLMVSTKDAQGNWQTPIALPSPINKGCEKFPRIMPDNRTLLFSSIREGGIESTFDLYETELDDNGNWVTPKFLTFANTKNHDYFSAVSSQFDKLYTNVKGANGYDIYSYDIPLAFKPKHKIVNIQGVVTTQTNIPLFSRMRVLNASDKQEVASLDNNASNGEYTIVLTEGKYQIICESDGYQKYSEIVDLSKIDEYKLIKKNIVLLPFEQQVKLDAFNSRNGKNVEAQWQVTANGISIEAKDGVFIAQYKTAYTITASSEGYPSVTQDFSISDMDSTSVKRRVSMLPKKPELKIMPRDADTKEPLEVNFMLRDLTHKRNLYKNKLAVDSVITLDFNARFRIYAMAKGHLFVKDIIDLRNQGGYEFIEYPLDLQPIQPGAKLTLKEIYFEFGSAELDKSSYEELVAVYNFLKYNKSLVVEISAHTDNVGSNTDNMDLSIKRAKSVVDYLISKGVPTKMLEGKGYGESQPIASNSNKNGRAQNRRVEFKVLKIR